MKQSGKIQWYFLQCPAMIRVSLLFFFIFSAVESVESITPVSSVKPVTSVKFVPSVPVVSVNSNPIDNTISTSSASHPGNHSSSAIASATHPVNHSVPAPNPGYNTSSASTSTPLHLAPYTKKSSRAFFISPDTLTAPRLYFPSDGTDLIPVKPVLRWQNVPDVQAYQLQLSTDPRFDDIETDSTGIRTPSFETDSLRHYQTYYWRVRSVSETRQGRWSDISSFTTIIEAPHATRLSTPESGAENVPVTPTFVWEARERAVVYRIQVSESPGFDEILWEAETDSMEGAPTVRPDDSGPALVVYRSERLEHLTRYYWRVRAENEGGAAPWSETGAFETIIAAPAVPSPVMPHHTARHVTVQPELRWREAERAGHYRIQLATDAAFDTLLTDRSDIREAALYIDSLGHATQYYWRVRAVNVGGQSSWSRAFMFTTIIERPDPPQLSSPVPDTLHQPVSPQMVWERAGRAVTYRLQLSKTPDFSTMLYNETGISDSTYSVFFLDHLTPYYWRVRASNFGGFSDWSETRKFTTIIAPPGKPEIAAPRDNDINTPVDITANWTRPDRAETYQVQVSRTNDFRFPSVGRDAIRDTSTFITGLNHAEDYYLRARAVNIGGAGEWSDPVHFRTIVNVPGQPVLTEPMNLVRHTSVNPVLRWRATERAAAYSIQVSSRPDFAILLVNQSDLNETSWQLRNLANDRTYYWRVRAMNTGGQSAWSAAWQFTTIVGAPAVPQPAIPSKFAVDVPVRPPMRWVRGDGAAQFELQLSVDAAFSEIIHEKKDIRDSTYVPPALEHEKSYFWRVRSVNRGGVSEWSEPLHFSTIIQAPPAPSLVSPDDFLFDIPSTGTLAWNSSPRAIQYDVQVSRDNDFSSREIDSAGVQVLYLDYSGLEGNRTYNWRVRAVNEGGKSPWSETWSFTTARSSFRSNLPQEVVLQQNHPNPFNPATQIRYGLPESADVRLEVYNTLGQLVSVLVSGQQPAGYHTSTFDASGLSNGIYVYRLFVGNQVITRKMTLVK